MDLVWHGSCGRAVCPATSYLHISTYCLSAITPSHAACDQTTGRHTKQLILCVPCLCLMFLGFPAPRFLAEHQVWGGALTYRPCPIPGANTGMAVRVALRASKQLPNIPPLG